MFSNLKIQVIASLLLASTLVSGAVIQDLLPEAAADGSVVKTYTTKNGNAHGRVIISSSKASPISATAGSISDNACWIETNEFPRTYFKRLEADQCFNIAAYHKLKIWKTPKCEDGSDAILVRYNAPGCQGEPSMKDDVGEDMIRTCLDMPTKEPASYAFWCTGEIENAGLSEAATSSNDNNNNSGNDSGSRKKGGLGTFILVLSLFGLFGLMLLVLTIYRCLKVSQWLLSFFNKDGTIVLN
ncbi:hypothetical protein F5X99DRAFT_171044 [Biscogniauxia marginata]|nr:hypothetical protein F5X99DRAFT_171044 [Biscogniauxia marginata]